MSSLIEQIRHGRIWDFPGGIHPPENKVQSSNTPIVQASLPKEFILPLKQHIGRPGDICVNVGDKVSKGQQLTQANLAFMVPIHAPSSGIVTAIEKRTIAHPSGLSDLCIVIEPDGEDRWHRKLPIPNYIDKDPEVLIEKIRQSGISGLGGAGFPTARKLHTGLAKTKILIINAAECEPYITADDRLMQDYATEVIQGIQVIQHILKPDVTIIGIEDNKPAAVEALNIAAQHSNMIIRVIPTKYPSGGSKQLIKVLTGREVPSKQHSAAIGVLMQNVGTAFAIKRAIIDGEPLIERVVTITGESMQRRGNVFARLGTPISFLLEEFGYKPEKKKPRLIMGGSLMGFTLPHAEVPITKITNCILAPKRKELAAPTHEMPCIRCSECAQACPASLLPQQLQWYAKAQDYEKCEEYHLSDCIECGACAYVCPSEIPLVQYYREAKSEIWTRKQEAKEADRAKQRFEERQRRLERDKQERENRFKQAAEKRRSEMKKTDGDDVIAAAIARVKAQKAATPEEKTVKPAVAAAIARAKAKQAEAAKAGQSEPDNSEMIKLREERKRQAREKKAQEQQNTQQQTATAESSKAETNTSEATPKNAAVAAAVARAKARKAAQADTAETETVETKPETQQEPVTDATDSSDPKKAAVAAAIARAKARKAAQADTAETETVETKPETQQELVTDATDSNDPKKAAVAAAIARAKARKAAQADTAETETVETKPETQQEPVADSVENDDPKKAAVAAAIARAKARKAAQADNTGQAETVETKPETQQEPVTDATDNNDPKKAAVAAAVARAKARKAAQAQSQPTDTEQTEEANQADDNITVDLLDIPVFIDKSSQEKK